MGMSLLNMALFQGTWFAAVLLGPLAAMMGCLLMLTTSTLRRTLQADLILVVLLGVSGFLLDTVWIHAGILDFGTGPFAPAWILLLWVAVALCLNHSMSTFVSKPWLGAAAAALSAPLSYLAGEALGKVEIPSPLHLTVISVVWFVVFYVVFARLVPAVNRFFKESH